MMVCPMYGVLMTSRPFYRSIYSSPVRLFVRQHTSFTKSAINGFTVEAASSLDQHAEKEEREREKKKERCQAETVTV